MPRGRKTPIRPHEHRTWPGRARRLLRRGGPSWRADKNPNAADQSVWVRARGWLGSVSAVRRAAARTSRAGVPKLRQGSALRTRPLYDFVIPLPGQALISSFDSGSTPKSKLMIRATATPSRKTLTVGPYCGASG
jgi:hypothetical protein